jgi:hypothetical protein
MVGEESKKPDVTKVAKTLQASLEGDKNKASSVNSAQSGTVADPTPVVEVREAAGAGSKSNTHTSFTK